MRVVVCMMLSGMICISTLHGEIANVYEYEQALADTEADYRLMYDIKTALRGGYYNKAYGNVIVSVRNGNVTLRGSVDSEEERNVVLESLRNVSGIKNLKNEISVQFSTSHR